MARTSEEIVLAVEVPPIVEAPVMTAVTCGATTYVVHPWNGSWIVATNDSAAFRTVAECLTGEGSDGIWDYEEAMHAARVKVRSAERKRLFEYQLRETV